MALIEQSEQSFPFLYVLRGGLCLKSKEPKEGYEKVEGEVDGRPYVNYIRKFHAVTGRITNVEWSVREVEDRTYRDLKITINDKGEIYILCLPFAKRAFDYFTKVAENIDYEQPVEFSAWQDKQDERVTAFACKQNGAFVQWRYTKDNPGDCPPPKQSALTKKWNFDDQREWLLDRILNVVIPHVAKINEFTEPLDEYNEDDAEAVAPVDTTSNKEPVPQAATKAKTKKAAASAKSADGEYDYNDETVEIPW